mgnify:CR=1 FL=1
MKVPSNQFGFEELRAARRESRALFWAAGLFSAFVNLLMLTGPLYMLQVYDRVLGSRSVATLLALTALVVFLYTMMGLLDYARGRIMARAGARFQARLDKRVFDAVMRKNALGHRCLEIDPSGALEPCGPERPRCSGHARKAIVQIPVRFKQHI